MTTRSVAILGGGVVGVTTGILLNLHGYRTRMYTNFRPDHFDPNSPPKNRPSEVASLHAAASVIPHSVEIDGWQIDSLTAISQAFFRRLAFSASCGVRYQKHFEVYEEPPNGDPTYCPPYSNVVGSFELLPADGSGAPAAPRRTPNLPIYGWSFDTIFAEAPTYLTKLYELYEASGGMVQLVADPPDDIMSLQQFLAIRTADVLVDCSGEKSRLLYPDGSESEDFVRGHYLKVKTQEVPVNSAGQHFSYNYSPSSDVYPAAGGGSADLYFYPRSDGWVLGGSRQRGRLVDAGEDEFGKRTWKFVGEETQGRTLRLNDVDFPAPIFELNRTLIRDMTGIDIEPFDRFAAIGYRFLPPRGVRLELDPALSEQAGGRPVIHNYGHGGAGYTLSWGTAYEVVRMVNRETGFEPQFIDRSGAFGNTAILSLLIDLCGELHQERETRSAQ